ncbi:MAG: hypothetical protein ACO3C4_02805 [Candidatus Limnocylindrus sp.]
MLDLVRLFVGGIGIVGFVYLALRLPPLLRARAEWANRMSSAMRYEAWRGTPGSGPDLVDRLEGELIANRLRRLIGVGIASAAGVLLALLA